MTFLGNICDISNNLQMRIFFNGIFRMKSHIEQMEFVIFFIYLQAAKIILMLPCDKFHNVWKFHSLGLGQTLHNSSEANINKQ